MNYFYHSFENCKSKKKIINFLSDVSQPFQNFFRMIFDTICVHQWLVSVPIICGDWGDLITTVFEIF